MVVATLDETTVTSGASNRWQVKLSTDRQGTPLRRPSADSPWPQLLRSESPTTSQIDVLGWSAQILFSVFRVAGPLISMRTNVAIGTGQTVCAVHYFNENHARAAQAQVVNTLNKQQQTKLKLYPFDPCTIFCGVNILSRLFRSWFSDQILDR